MIHNMLLHIAIVGNGCLRSFVEKSYSKEEILESFSFFNSLDIPAINNTHADIIIFEQLPPKVLDLSCESFPLSVERILCLCAKDEALFASLPTAVQTFFTGFWPSTPSQQLLPSLLTTLFHSAKERKKLVMSQIYLDTLINSIPDLVWFKDLRGSHLKVNDAFGKAVGKTKEQCEDRGHYYIWDLEPDDYANGEYVCLETEEEVINLGKTCLFDEKVLSKSGLRQFKTYKSPLFNLMGEMIGTTGIAKDVTDLQNLSLELEVILSSLPFATLIAGEGNSIVYVNNKFCEYFSMEKQDVLAGNYPFICEQVIGVAQEKLCKNDLMEVLVNEEDSLKVFRLQQELIQDIFGNHFGFFLICLDVTKEYELQQKILTNANTDFLTGIYNRRYFYQELDKRKQKEAISLIYFDLDNFKIVNDTYGHQVGDQALILITDFMKSVFQNHLIARLGGDEFIVAAFDCVDVNLLKTQVDEFIVAVTNKFGEHRKFKSISVSAGIAYNDQLDSNIDLLLLHADNALYDAKSHGKSCSRIYIKN